MDTREDTGSYYPSKCRRDTREDTGNYYPGGTVVPVDKVPAHELETYVQKQKGLEVKTNTISNLREAVKDLAKALGATVVSVFAAMVACGAEVQTAKLADLDLDSNPTVVTNVTLEGLATEDAALLPVYYPEGNVTSIDQITTEGLTYSLNDDGTATVTGYTGSATDVIIPWKAVIDGVERKVTVIGASAFSEKPIITLIAPNTVRTVAAFAFYYSIWLKSASLPAVETVEEGAFYWCYGLSKVSLPLVRSIGRTAFSECSLESVFFPAATFIGERAFYMCWALKSISVPAATTIDTRVFELCRALQNVDFGSTPRGTVPTLGNNAFIEVPTTCKIIIPLGMYDEWIAAPVWRDLSAAGYKFVGYANAADVVPASVVTNIARSVVNTVWDDKLGVAWEARMHNGALYYVAVTNRQEVAE